MGKLFKMGSFIIELQMLMIPGACDEWQWCDLWLRKIVKEKEEEKKRGRNGLNMKVKFI